MSCRAGVASAAFDAAGDASAAIVEITDATQTADGLSFSIDMLEGDVPSVGESVAFTIDFTATGAQFTIPQ